MLPEGVPETILPLRVDISKCSQSRQPVAFLQRDAVIRRRGILSSDHDRDEVMSNDNNAQRAVFFTQRDARIRFPSPDGQLR